MKLEFYNIWYNNCDIHFITIGLIDDELDGNKSFNIVIFNFGIRISFKK